MDNPTKHELIEDGKRVFDEHGNFTRALYRKHGKYAERYWLLEFGNFSQFKSEIVGDSRYLRRLLNRKSLLAHEERYKRAYEELKDYEDKYTKPSDKRFKTILVGSDFHDKMVDPFALEVFIDTAKRMQPDVICLAGDIFDMPEVSKYSKDFRDMDIVGRIKFVHEHLFEPLRKSCPNTTIDFLNGNHEARLVNHLAEIKGSNMLQVLLSDLHDIDIPQLLGLDKYQINFISKHNMYRYNVMDRKKAIPKNYKVYWDSFVIVHDPKDAESYGIPGCSGHHHRPKVTQNYTIDRGAYQWNWLGCMCKTDASYCDGEKWTRGFGIIHIDTKTKTYQMDNIMINGDGDNDFVIVLGKVYRREDMGL